MQIQAADVPDKLPAGPARAYLVIGEEPLLAMEAAAAIRRRLQDSGFDERIVLHPGAGFDWARLHAEGNALSLFSSQRLIEVPLAGGKPGADGAAALGKFLEHGAEDTVLLVLAVTETAPKPNAAWIKAFDSAGVVVLCRPLRADRLPAWLAARAKTLGLDIERDALQWLAQQVEGNLLAAAQELAKLPLLAGTGRIGLDQMRDAVADNARFASWDLPDRALLGDLAGARRMLTRLREEGVEPVIVVAAVARDIRSLYAAAIGARGSNADAGLQAAGIWRTRHPQFRRALGVHGTRGAGDLLREAGALDRLAKSAPSPRVWEELLNLIVRLAAPAARRAA